MPVVNLFDFDIVWFAHVHLSGGCMAVAFNVKADKTGAACKKEMNFCMQPACKGEDNNGNRVDKGRARSERQKRHPEGPRGGGRGRGQL